MGAVAKVDAAGFVPKCGATFKWRQNGKAFTETFTDVVSYKPGSHDVPIPIHAWLVDRARYDAILLQHAIESGVEVHQDTAVRGALTEGDRVVGLRVQPNAGATCEVRSEFVVDCSGMGRVLGRALGLPQREHPLGDFGVYRYYEDFTWNHEYLGHPGLSRVLFLTCPAGWLWFIAFAPNQVSVGLVTQRECLRGRTADSLLDEQIAAVPEIAEMLAPARRIPAPGWKDQTRTHIVDDHAVSFARAAGPGWYLAGDAAAFVDPLLSSGVFMAHQGGLLAANAINTEWSHPEIAPSELHDQYSQYYGDLWSGLVGMVDWWYCKRDPGEGRDLWRQALDPSSRPRAVVDDASDRAFFYFVAGYLSDSRFPNVGIGFGIQGLRLVVEGMTGDGKELEKIETDIANRELRLVRRFTHAEPLIYMGTSVDSDRWWKLPGVRFTLPDRTQCFRPPVPPGRRGPNDLARMLGLIQTVLQLCNGRHSVEQVVRLTRQRIPWDERYVHETANRVLTDLKMMGVLAPAA